MPEVERGWGGEGEGMKYFNQFSVQKHTYNPKSFTLWERICFYFTRRKVCLDSHTGHGVIVKVFKDKIYIIGEF